MDYFELTKKRHSYRGDYTPKKTTIQDLKLILSAALNAPTGCNAQSTEFVVVTDENLLNDISNVITMRTVKSASALIFCVINMEPKNVVRDLSFEIEDCSAAAMSMLLAITELGYASVWLDGMLRDPSVSSKLGEIIGLPSNKRVQIMLPIGEPSEVLEQPAKRSEAERVSFNKYAL